MCFLPNSRASMDQAPGPTIAKTAPRIASEMGIHGSPECEEYREKAIDTLTMAASTPATGVYQKKYSGNDSCCLQDDWRQRR